MPRRLRETREECSVRVARLGECAGKRDRSASRRHLRRRQVGSLCSEQGVLGGVLNTRSLAHGAASAYSATFAESEVESPEHEDEADVHCQPCPELVPEEQHIYRDNRGCQDEYNEYGCQWASHVSPPFNGSAASEELGTTI